MQSGITLTGNKVKIGGVDIDALAKKYDTPLYVFCEKRIIDNYNTFLKSFTRFYKNTSIFYSIKTNSEIQILQTIRRAGSNAEAASAMEVELALKAGFKANQIIIDGPAWTNEEIEYCVKKGIRTFNVDSVDLLERVNKVAKKNKKIVNVSFRIFPELRMLILKGFVESFISKFGVPYSQAVDAYRQAKDMSNVNPVAISAHIGSMITDPSYFEKEVDVLTKLAKTLKDELNIDIKEINIGGGYGVQSLNYYSIQSAILEKAGVEKYHKASSIEEFGERIAKRFKENVDKYNLSNVALILEPGRFLVSDSGALVTSVVAVKNDWVFVNGGINLIPESIFFIRRGFLIANKIGQSLDKVYNVAGPTLNTVDVLASKQKLPNMEVGDTVVVLDVGAYSLTRSNQFTILRPNAVYVTKNKKVKLLRKKETSREILNKMLL